MARGRQTLTQRIALDGGDEIRKELESLGVNGRKAFKQLQQAAEETAKAGSGFNKFLQDARKYMEDVKRAGKDLQKQLNQLGSDFRHTTKRAAQLVAAVSAAAAALFAFTKSGAQAADDIAKTATAVGLTTEEYGRLEHAMAQSGVETSRFVRSMGRLSEEMQKTFEEGENADTTLNKLGISVVGAGGKIRSSSAVLAELADILAAMPDGVEKTAIAMDLFGSRAGTQLLPFLNLGSAGMRELGEEAERLGLVLDSEAAAIGTEMVDAVEAMQRTFKALHRDLALLLAPAFTDLAKTIAATLGENRDSIMEFGASVRDIVVPIIQDLVALLEGRDADVVNGWILSLRDGAIMFGDAVQLVGTVFSTVFGAIEATIQSVLNIFNALFGTEITARQVIMFALLGKFLGLFRLIGSAVGVVRASFVFLQQVFGNVVATAVGLGAAISTAVNLIGEAITAVGELIGGTLGRILDWFIGSNEEVGEAVTDMSERTAGAVEDLSVRVTDAGEEMAENVQTSMADSAQESESVFQKAINAIKGFFEDLGSRAMSILRGILDVINNIIAAAKKAASAVASAASGKAEGGPVGFAAGGGVSGPGTSTSDSILARLSNGEYVIRAAAVRKYGAGLFEALNNLRISGGAAIRQFATGGLVTGMMSPSLATAPAIGGAGTGMDGRPITLNIGGERFSGLMAPQEVAARLVRFATDHEAKRNGKSPRWYKG